MGIAAIDGASAVGAIRLAAARTGVDFGYLVAQARIESGLDTHAKAATSSARGLFQFTQGTWLEMVRRHGAEHGMADAAAVLRRGATPQERAAILDLRHDAGASSAMAAAFAQDNAALIERRLGRTASPTDLYLAHFLGPAGAVRFLRARDAAPAMAAESAVLPAAARANAGVFRGRSLDEVYARFEAKLGSADRHSGEGRNPAASQGHGAALRGQLGPRLRGDDDSGTTLPPTGTGLPVAAARTAYLLLAELGA